jgi:uncharacterized protein (DUF1800 family)
MLAYVLVMATREDLAHLLRRATFGPRAEELDAAERVGRDTTLATLLAPAGPDAGAARTPVPQLGADPYLTLGKNPSREQKQQAQQERRAQIRSVTLWWLDRMVAADHGLHEKLTFFWHGHWATSVEKVKSAALLLGQQQTFSSLGRGEFGGLVRAMVRDPALIVWLDGQRNTRQAPNENLARELMELFTIGIGSYSEADVKEGARALTGWQLDRAQATVVFNPARHDAGNKTILGKTGPFGTDEFAELLVAQPAAAQFIAARLWFRFASGEPIPAAVSERIAAAFGDRRDVSAMVRAVFADAEYAGTRNQLVKQPVEWAVGAMRQLEVRPSGLAEAKQRQLVQLLTQLGQVPFAPPSVGGWPSGRAWLTTSATQLRLRGADFLAAAAAPSTMDKLMAAPAAQRPDALARLLVVDRFSERTHAVLAGAATNPRRLLTLGLASPEYIVS